MNRLLKADSHKWLLGLATAIAAASFLWLWRQQGVLRILRAQPVAVHLTGSPYESANLKLPESRGAVWPKASPQSSGQDWLYEVFTPPVIYYNRLARAFSVTPPLYAGEDRGPFGLELLEVKQEQFRLQLVGYFGAPGDYLAAFTSPSQPETLLARAGRRFDNLGLTLKSFDVGKIIVDHNEPGPVYDVAALAVLADDQTGAEVVLDSRARKYTGVPVAVLKGPAGGGPPRELHEGDTFTDDNTSYRIERVQLDPPEVVVARTTSGLPQPETKVLRPLPAVAKLRTGLSSTGQLAVKAPVGKPPTGHPANSLANSDK